MKILKLVQIDNVGKFQKYSCHGDMNLSDISLIYGENGKGKTTLSTILRSLKTGDVSLIREKKCAGGQGPINVKILLEKNRIAEFSEDSETWSIQNSDLEIFDSYHVNNNVYSGDHVDHTHKKNLYYLVIGEQGVHMAQEIEQIDSEIKDINDSIKVIENQIKSYISSKCSVESFVNLPEIENIGQRIAQVTNEIKELEEAESIQSTPTLTQVLLPKLKIEELSQLLEKSFETVSEEAKSNVITHCLSLGANSESWVKQGVDYLQNKSLSTCPFCQQNIEQIDIIQHFKMYFSQKYTELREEINSFLTIFESDFSENTLLGIQSTLGTNSSLVNFWEKYISLDIDIISFSQLVEIRKEIFLCVKEILYQKSNKPLEIIQYGDELSDLFTSYGNITSDIERYNEQILKINDQISSKKMTTQKGDLVKTRLIKLSLEDTLMRFSEEAKPICEDYISKKNTLTSLKVRKQEKSSQLKEYSESVFDKYKSTINEYLAKFGADFEIVDPKTSLQGGTPSATYMLRINNVVVPLGTTETVGEPCFRTILSDGDKNSLAFAFFMAQMKLDPNISDKVLIIDDPITSLDIHRKNRTFQEIREISKNAKQTILLSHDAHFLKLFWENLPNVKTFQIIRENNQSDICEWDIQKETLPSYLQDYFRLDNYLLDGDSDLRGVVRCIRPVLEGNLRFRFPKSFGTKEWLGDFLEKIQKASSDSNLSRLQPFLSELSSICSYSSRYHHQQNPLADKEEVLDSELKTYVTRTLSLLEKL